VTMRIISEINQLADPAAAVIFSGFNAFQEEFRAITRRARSRFERRDWHGMQADSVERLNLYKKIVDGVVAETARALRESVRTEEVWARMKSVYSSMIAGDENFELAETFFNSITRRIFITVGVDRGREFIDSDFNLSAAMSAQPVYHTLKRFPNTEALVRAILFRYPFNAQYESFDANIRAAARAIDGRLGSIETSPAGQTDMLKSIFYRNKGAYIVGRIRLKGKVVPLVFALRHSIGGISIDAVLTDENDVSIIFSFTRSYFSVEVENPHEVIEFLMSIMPQKRKAELYISIGYNKHGKTELYRDLLHHLRSEGDLFEVAPGDKGMVMMVFDLPRFDIIFKIIKDRFDYPKTSTRRDVMDKYALVFKHDRAGRLADAQEFEYLEFDRARFREDLLMELRTSCAGSVTVMGDKVAIKHLYTERKMTPLNLFLREADEAAACAAVTDYGQAVKDMAATNIFPGDMLLKNFGVTRHGRVVFYDYDELGLLTDYHFRKIPQSRHYDEEMSAEPWFSVGENDIFPEEFIKFLGLQPGVEKALMEAHRDLFDADFWTCMQQRIRDGEIVDIYPYPRDRRLRNG
jgi:isocitrate dehydrogenase kinase/phosphatase